MNLVLIGYRGTGKTVLGKIIHQRMDWPVHHCDRLLEERFGRSIAEFVKENGWDAFREEEERLIAELASLDGVILDTGGGVVTRAANIEALRRNGFLVWLQSDPASIARWIKGDANRPSLTGAKSAVDEIREVLAEREPLYRSAAHYSLRTDMRPLEESADEIIQAYTEHLASMRSS
jgi:shikimate kinase